MTTRTHVDRRRLSPEHAEALERMRLLNEDARENWGEPGWHREMAAVISDTIYWGFQHENVLQLMTTVDTVGLNDRITIDEVRGLRVFWTSLGGYIEQSTLVKDTFELQKDQAGFHVSENEDKMLANFVVESGNLSNLAIQMMDVAMNQKFVALVQAAIPSSSPYYIHGNGLSLAALNTAIAEVQDESFDEIPAIIGRATMINQIWNALVASNQFLPESNEELMRQGVLGVYRGCRVIKLINYRDDIRRPYFPGNELYVVGRDASKFGFWGGLTTKEWNEQGGWYWHLMGRRLAGGAMHRPERARRIKDDTLPA